MMSTRSAVLRPVLVAAIVVVALAFAGMALPKWFLFLATMAIAHATVALGLIFMMRGGLVSFGQGLPFCLGAYAAGLGGPWLGLTDAVLLLLLGGLTAGAVAAVFGSLLARYRGIFFAMLTLSLSMVLYGLLVKATAIGGSDGLNLARPAILGYEPTTETADYALYLLAVVTAGVLSAIAALHFNSVRGLMSLAVKENELRVEYMGASVRSLMAVNFIIAGVYGGVGGALAAIALGHIEPTFSYWTTSGEMVFLAILAGQHSVIAVFLASLILELVRSFANLYFPETWQLALGAFLLVVILFLPRGLGSLWHRGHKPAAPATDATEETGR
ncbi:branched-chain amino acid ABC transporter permease [Tistrella bauzanensis]|jgi:branched-chain amino acid transport system permease protein